MKGFTLAVHLEYEHTYGKESLKTLKEQIKEDGLPKDMFDDWESGFTNYIRSRFYYNGTGIV
ncbi:MAG: hypothetical protein PUH41_08750, partial [Prevotella sp.]|nr:hypothetical protein [Prevotella sp.]